MQISSLLPWYFAREIIGDVLTNQRTTQFLRTRELCWLATSKHIRLSRTDSVFSWFLSPATSLKSSTSTKIGMEFHNISVRQTAVLLVVASAFVDYKLSFSDAGSHLRRFLSSVRGQREFDFLALKSSRGRADMMVAVSFNRYSESSIEPLDTVLASNS